MGPRSLGVYASSCETPSGPAVVMLQFTGGTDWSAYCRDAQLEQPSERCPRDEIPGRCEGSDYAESCEDERLDLGRDGYGAKQEGKRYEYRAVDEERAVGCASGGLAQPRAWQRVALGKTKDPEGGADDQCALDRRGQRRLPPPPPAEAVPVQRMSSRGCHRRDHGQDRYHGECYDPGAVPQQAGDLAEPSASGGGDS